MTPDPIPKVRIESMLIFQVRIDLCGNAEWLKLGIVDRPICLCSMHQRP